MRRTSNLMAPILLLEGHQGEIYTTEFHPKGEMLLSSGYDRQICKFCEFDTARLASLLIFLKF